jgi:hypothetical protein
MEAKMAITKVWHLMKTVYKKWLSKLYPILQQNQMLTIKNKNAANLV